MSFRALSSLLTRRFSARRIPAAQAETIGSASGRPTRSLHTLTSLDAAVTGRGALAVAGGVAALVGFLYLKKDNKAGEGANNVVAADMKAALNDPAIMAMFTDKDGNVAWMQYNDYLHFRLEYLDEKKSDTDKKAIRGACGSGKQGKTMKVNEAQMKRRFDELRKVHDKVSENHMNMIMEQKKMVKEHKVDDAVMKKRFEAWMEEYGRTYKGKEKARRYEAFKLNALIADKLDSDTPGGARFSTSKFSDWTEAELEGLCSRHGDFDWESYFEELRTMYAGGGRRMLVDPEHCTDAVKGTGSTEGQTRTSSKQALASEKTAWYAR